MQKRIVKHLNGCKLFRNGEKFYIHKSTSLPEYVGVMHSHDFVEIVYVISGECVHMVNNTQVMAKKGDLFLINAGTVHANCPVKDKENPFIAYDCIFTPDFLDYKLIDSNDFMDLNASFLFSSIFPDVSVMSPDLQLIGNVSVDYDRLFISMLNEYTDMKKGYINIIRTYLAELLIKIFRELDLRKNINIDSDKIKYINQAIELIRKNYHTNIKLGEIAFKSFLSKSYFSKLFKEVTGYSFVNYLQCIRIEEACALLATTDMTITDIAIKTGFNDLKFFYDVFKKLTGKTPGEYRSQKS